MSGSNEAIVPLAGLKPHVQPWEMLKWSNSQLCSMYTDWGIYYERTGNLPASMRYLNKAMDLDPNDTSALRRRAHVKRMQGRAPAALLDCSFAKAILRNNNPKGFDHKVNLEVCDSLYESNKLENALRSLHHNMRLFSYSKVQPVQNRLTVITENINDALSDATSPAAHRLINKMMHMKEGNRITKSSKPACDVLSILETEQEFLVPLEKSRRKRQFKIYNERYLDKFWQDVGFLKELRENPNLLIDQFSESSANLKSMAEDSYKIARTFTKMLHTRCPMYCRNAGKNELYQQENLFRIQYQTRRNMFKILRTIRNLIRSNKMNKLTKFVDEVMGNYVTVKTNRIMPWKFEFVNEVYNYLGLARINEYKIPTDMKILGGRQRLMKLFKIPTELDLSRQNKYENIFLRRQFVVDPKTEKFKKLSARYEYRMRFAKYPIERSYLYHEYAQAHLNINSFDACCLLARKSIDEALRCNSYVWAVLSALVACKAHTILGKVEKQKEMLNEAFRLAKKLKSIDLCLFIDICLKVNTEEIDLKKHMVTPDGSIRKRSRRSGSSSEVTPSESSLEAI
ncbi:uncharacterized protein LOC133837149 isoform X1 [Drosophila sulfurigaster albostrigata]|uniref:uncharacterized protein LOC133837149 isoform X1 n=1 Tax=Drosophila sulfurigaster albostrigata TaxID=89887 RepID=UPI002D21A9A9|nr:uncharacterized protein LOC133837149 isoform X1 [Drosophila sulfurigaster albostrigata]